MCCKRGKTEPYLTSFVCFETGETLSLEIMACVYVVKGATMSLEIMACVCVIKGATLSLEIVAEP
jgi:hypothetical protein